MKKLVVHQGPVNPHKVVEDVVLGNPDGSPFKGGSEGLRLRVAHQGHQDLVDAVYEDEPSINIGGKWEGNIDIDPTVVGVTAINQGAGARLTVTSDGHNSTILGSRFFAETTVAGQGVFISGYKGGTNTLSGDSAHLLGHTMYGQNTQLTGRGATFLGYKGYDITFPLDGVVVSGKGALVMGATGYGPDKMKATADGAIQVGGGENAQEYSFAVGADLRLNGKGEPSSPRNGDVWVDGSGNVMVRTGGVTKNLSNIS